MSESVEQYKDFAIHLTHIKPDWAAHIARLNLPPGAIQWGVPQFRGPDRESVLQQAKDHIDAIPG